MTGYNYNSTLASLHFWLILSVLTSRFPQHFLGLAGMPRRYIDYPEASTDGIWCPLMELTWRV